MNQNKTETGKTEYQPVLRLASFWQSRVAAIYRVVPARPLSPKEMGQFKQLRRNLGDETIDVIGWALDNWSTFAQQARERAGLCSHPANPHIP